MIFGIPVRTKILDNSPLEKQEMHRFQNASMKLVKQSRYISSVIEPDKLNKG